MTIIQSIILAIVEGLTEFLPVSSTGHMILTQGVLGMESTAYTRAFTVMIQFGAILSVLVLYWRRFLPWYNPKGTGEHQGLQGWSMYRYVIIASVPAIILGLLLDDYIDALLGNVWVVVSMLFVGGIAMIYLDRCLGRANPKPITDRSALIVGLAQCLAMIPGVSRSMATIFGGMSQGLSRRQAAEFSFFMAVPIMFGATLLKGYKLYKEFGFEIFVDNWQTLLIGNLVAFVVALVAIKGFIGVVAKYGFRAFGYYRIIIAIVFALLMLSGVSVTMD